MRTFEYDAIAFRQQLKAPLQVAFVAHAAEVVQWAGVPRKSDELLTGYQRFRDDNRINQEIVPFFLEEKNSSPTAIIVALRKNSGIGGCELSVPDDLPAGQIVEAKLTITLDEDALTTDRVFEAASRLVSSRLPTGAAEEPEAEGDEEEEGEEAASEEEEEEESEALVHLGSATLARLKELLEAKDNWTNERFREAMGDFVKPALLIDGQHRVAAAAKIGAKGLPFIVCGLFNAAWEEQVFQFTVVNLKPRRIPPSLITSIAALSLTRAEQSTVESRLEQAGVKMAEVTVMSLVAYDDRSPFADRVYMAVGSPDTRGELLGYGSIKRVANVWYRAGRSSLTQIARQLFQTNSTSNARRQWKAERAWFDFFSTFWTAVRERYSENLWRKAENNHLLVGATLWALQEAILSEADGQMPNHWKVPVKAEGLEERVEFLKGRLLEVVNTCLAYFPEELWTIEWVKASQDTNQGRQELVLLFEKFIDKGKKGGMWKGWKQDSWFSE